MGAGSSKPVYQYITCCGTEKATYLRFRCYNHERVIVRSPPWSTHEYFDPMAEGRHPEIEHACCYCIRVKLEQEDTWARFPEGLCCNIVYTLSGQTPKYKVIDAKKFLLSLQKERKLRSE